MWGAVREKLREKVFTTVLELEEEEEVGKEWREFFKEQCGK